MRAARRLLVVSTLATCLLPLAGPAAADVMGTVDTSGGGSVNLRVRATYRSAKVGSRADGRRARLRCRKEGAEVAGTRRWYKLRRGAVVSAALIDAPAAARDLRTCGRPRGDDYYVRYTGESIDPFRFYSRYCTSFAAWRANQIGVNFSNFYKDQHWGNAEHWDEAARAAGITVARTPKRGDIAQWNPNVNGASSAGHVGYVARVFDDGSVRIAEYNWGTPREFGTRRVHRSKISNFIRLKG